LRVGSAEVSTKHANFVQADAGGSADDVRELMESIRRRVYEHAGVDLHPETRLVGFAEHLAQLDVEG
jgi:UDP-N-acetylmuramate dehydrogenase